MFVKQQQPRSEGSEEFLAGDESRTSTSRKDIVTGPDSLVEPAMLPMNSTVQSVVTWCSSGKALVTTTVIREQLILPFFKSNMILVRGTHQPSCLF